MRYLVFLLLSTALYAHEGAAAHTHGSELFNQKCFACHRLDTQKYAPPLFAVKKVHMDRYGNKTAAKAKIAEFLQTGEKPIMQPAVKKFGVMPKVSLSAKERALLAEFLIENDHPKPQWFQKHYKQHLKSGELDHGH